MTEPGLQIIWLIQSYLHICKLKFMQCLRFDSLKIQICTKKTTKAFQSHFRKELVNGIIDEECLCIAKNLVKKYKNPLI